MEGNPLAPNAPRFAALPAARAHVVERFRTRTTGRFPRFVGLALEEVRSDYARMRLPYRPELDQLNGVVHGGVLATLLDTVVVPAIASGYDEVRRALTIGLEVQFLAPVIGEDLVAEGWVVRRGRSTVFCRAEARSASAELVATGTLIYKVGSGA